MVSVEDQAEVEQFIRESDFPNRLRLALYITHYPGKKECVYRRAASNLKCVEDSIYPLNRLRNIAISNIQTTHFIVFDMDMWPARSSF